MDNAFDAAREFLQTQSTLALATVDAGGRPQVAPVYYVADRDLSLYWLSFPGTRHGASIGPGARVAAAVYPAVWEWRDIRGVQLEGDAAPVTDGRRREEILSLYRRKFALPAAFGPLMAAATLYCLRPAWVRWVDNGVGFGHKVETTR